MHPLLFLLINSILKDYISINKQTKDYTFKISSIMKLVDTNNQYET